MQKQSFYIDKITESIEDANTGESYETDVIPVSAQDLKSVLKKYGWRFNWQQEFKICDISRSNGTRESNYYE